jgi:hypothetical protein
MAQRWAMSAASGTFGAWARWARVLAFTALALLASVVVPLQARADGSDQPPADNERVIQIGPQAVVIANERGQLRMYDDPSQKASSCRSLLACMGDVLTQFGLVGYMVFDNATTVGLEHREGALPRVGPSE